MALANPQLQSPFARLPGEIRNQIYRDILLTASTITDPTYQEQGRRKSIPGLYNSSIPKLGASLISTCRFVHAEAPVALLYSGNRFSFTRAEHAAQFLQQSPTQGHVLDLEIDLRALSQTDPWIAREWLAYLEPTVAPAWPTQRQATSVLKMDAPNLKTLRLNFSSWPKIDMPPWALWKILFHMLERVRGLERILLVGVGKGLLMRSRDPWSSLLYVGSDNVGNEDLVAAMWPCVGNTDTKDEEKIMLWERDQEKIRLEVALRPSAEDTARRLEQSAKSEIVQSWPENGTCTWSQYQHYRAAFKAAQP